LINLLENALQASGNGGHAEISISAANGWLRIGVTDCGAGIEPDSRELVFEPFYTARPDGNGLGLSIVRNVVHAHDGSIEILSAAGCGSEFVVRLPLVAETAAAEEQHAC
jgi:signal transduction histidine kinase